MNDKFFDLKKEKQDKMINGAMSIFARNGYRRASTDDMVKEVGVSKGLWFHYFGSKLGLYTFVADYAIKYMNMELAASLGSSEKDYFEILKSIEQVKMTVGKMYPFVPLFISSVVNETDPEAVGTVKGYVDAFGQKISKALENADETLFREDIDRNLLSMSISFTMRGILEEEYAKPVFAQAEYMKRVTDYLDMMKTLCYREE